MSLDIYIMPLWRFKAGDFSTAVEREFADSKSLTLSGIAESTSRQLSALKAKMIVRRTIANVRRELGITVTCLGEGAVQLSEQAPLGFETLRTYAKWLDYQDELPLFERPDNGNYYTHPIWSLKNLDERLRFSQLVRHSCYTGYFFPDDFDRVVYVDEGQRFAGTSWKASVGSSVRLVQELEALGALLPPEQGAETVSRSDAWTINESCRQLARAAKLSVESKLPLIFYG